MAIENEPAYCPKCDDWYRGDRDVLSIKTNGLCYSHHVEERDAKAKESQPPSPTVIPYYTQKPQYRKNLQKKPETFQERRRRRILQAHEWFIKNRPEK